MGSLLLRLLPKLPLRLPKRKETAKEIKVKKNVNDVTPMLSDTTVKTLRSELAKSLMVSQNGPSDIWATARGRKITSSKLTEWKNGTTDLKLIWPKTTKKALEAKNKAFCKLFFSF